MTYQYLTVDMIATAKEKSGFIDRKTFKTAVKYGFDSLILTDACKCSVATSRTLDLCLIPSAISFSSTEMETNTVNWGKS